MPAINLFSTVIDKIAPLEDEASCYYAPFIKEDKKLTAKATVPILKAI